MKEQDWFNIEKLSDADNHAECAMLDCLLEVLK